MIKIFKIRRGFHYCFHLPKLQFNLKELNFIVNFDKNCEYHLGDNDQLDINKLYGISWGWHHKNSFRIGWNYDEINKNIKLLYYMYNNSIKSWDYICSIPFEYNLQFNIKFLKEFNTIIVKLNNKDFEIIDFEFPKIKWGWKLFPYFGGNKKAPNTMTIKIKQL